MRSICGLLVLVTCCFSLPALGQGLYDAPYGMPQHLPPSFVRSWMGGQGVKRYHRGESMPTDYSNLGRFSGLLREAPHRGQTFAPIDYSNLGRFSDLIHTAPSARP